MPTITCPECKSSITFKDDKAMAGRTIRCPRCGVSVPVAAEAPAFPKKNAEETILDISDAVKAVRRKRSKKDD